jgi:hypothetical protein
MGFQKPSVPSSDISIFERGFFIPKNEKKVENTEGELVVSSYELVVMS